MSKGRFIALSPKAYYCFNEDTGEVKFGSKGVPKSCNLTLATYLECLYGLESHKIEMQTLRLNREKQMSRIKMRKRGLSDIAVKFFVDDDKITCRPLKKNKKYV